jgi:hypothetical protein
MIHKTTSRLQLCNVFLTVRISAGIFDRQQFAERINNNDEEAMIISTPSVLQAGFTLRGKVGVFLNGYEVCIFGKISVRENRYYFRVLTAVAPAVYYYIPMELHRGTTRHFQVWTE